MKIKMFIIGALVLCLFMSCKNQSPSLMTLAQQCNNMTPYKVNDGIVTQVSYENSIYKTTIEISDSVFQTFNNDLEIWKRNYMNLMASSSGEGRKLFEEYAKYNVTQVYEYKKEGTNEVLMTITILPEEAQKALGIEEKLWKQWTSRFLWSLFTGRFF